MKNLKVITLSLSLALSILSVVLFVLPAIDHNAQGEYCHILDAQALEENAESKVANWTSQGRPCRLEAGAIALVAVSFLFSFVLSFVFIFLSGLLVVSLRHIFERDNKT